ncbi:MAG TPA: hypothetical protein PLF32_10200, partial [Bacteroidales bacterium]|nr:hypothetical protein [Bacteroidales bacterium]
ALVLLVFRRIYNGMLFPYPLFCCIIQPFPPHVNYFVGFLYTFVYYIFQQVTFLLPTYRYFACRKSLRIQIISDLHCILYTYAHYLLFAPYLVLFYCRLSLQIGILYYDLQA